ncbi:MAG TPA: RNA ligase (ATP) [Cyanobacteria bacterium UBA11149]|nr:RNA ligase (ATP) [Cyanobacteria bacterium UBA11367]HBE57408.1 RNA ligase (ATP) [Cyanobacteria bacterium UBA11366]HBK64609.1 RNA ligase (ATP) [Cyanobacteria bacterium UBA11166]HBR77101.1 RNA ligase (ATP) [Cyanobacteria bacterium UBA11159]HBS68552.1 RNA ligase (ATP) [Cyanobacteria bacterium UBA11153]HBW92492.1 RNA ligase (ATP) [Cyanobacteria bacterium UBA11149]HCA97590.1 RNA ligase (ATP) [Cyanobacteria bacterium UBA9226]
MSIFKVEVVEINRIIPHPNADRLDIATFVGMAYQVIVAKGSFQVGNLAFYFPIDSVIPEDYLDKFGIRPYYSKKLRAARLRGIFSEGLLIPVEDNFTGKPGEDYSSYFGVTKYEYPIPIGMNGDMESHIGQYKFPSPENLKRYKDILQDGEEVVVTEKLHGTCWTVLVDGDGTKKLGSHNYFWKDNETNKGLVYVRAYHENPALAKLPPNTQIFGEIYGVQDIKYGLKNGKIGIAIFAVKSNGRFLDYGEFVNFCEEFNLPKVPILYQGAYSWEAVSQFNNANSVISPECMMEGVVVQPLIERTTPEIGRVVMKLISDRYLLRKDGTELH